VLLQEAGNPLAENELIFPALQVIHIAGFTLLAGSNAIVDFRILGWGMTRQTPLELEKDLTPWSLAGLILVLTSGGLLFSSDPDLYYLNIYFQIKMALLLVALGFQHTIHRRTIKSGKLKPWVAWTSILLWFGIIAGGVFIAFV
jgi:hypothetical protein